MRTKDVDGVILHFPESKWEELWWGMKGKGRRKYAIKELKKVLKDYSLDRISITKAYFKHIGKAFMYFLKSFVRKPVEFGDYIPYHSIRLSRPPKRSENYDRQPLPGPLDHF